MWLVIKIVSTNSWANISWCIEFRQCSTCSLLSLFRFTQIDINSTLSFTWIDFCHEIGSNLSNPQIVVHKWNILTVWTDDMKCNRFETKIKRSRCAGTHFFPWSSSNSIKRNVKTIWTSLTLPSTNLKSVKIFFSSKKVFHKTFL